MEPLSKVIVVPTWVMTGAYIWFVILGIVGAVAGVPTLDLTTPEGYTTIWGAGIAVTAAIAAVGSRLGRDGIEKWGGVGLVSILSVYTISAFYLVATSNSGPALGRAAFSVVLIILMWFPAIRITDLLRRTGIRK